ncbi:MAG: esterase-like activity of phytase family protein [Pseudomonadota bacterium]
MHRRFALAIIALAVLSASAVAVGSNRARFVDSFNWRLNAPWFGGFSGLELSEDGNQMTVLSDRATILTAQILRESGRVVAIRAGRPHKIRSSRNKVLSGRAGDSEGLAIAADGTVFISFEGIHRVAHHPAFDAASRVLPRPKAFTSMAPNGSFEPLAIDSRGRLYTLPESSRTADGQIPVYRWDGRRWTGFGSLPPSGGFQPVGADIGPDGRFYLLERATGFLGFKSRLTRWRIGRRGLVDPETLLQTSNGTHDNLEAVSVWRDRQGRLRATMISDDNFLPVQRTEIVEYTLPE